VWHIEREKFETESCGKSEDCIYSTFKILHDCKPHGNSVTWLSFDVLPKGSACLLIHSTLPHCGPSEPWHPPTLSLEEVSMCRLFWCPKSSALSLSPHFSHVLVDHCTQALDHFKLVASSLLPRDFPCIPLWEPGTLKKSVKERCTSWNRRTMTAWNSINTDLYHVELQPWLPVNNLHTSNISLLSMGVQI
jgi:hypothetical protein